MDSSTLLWQREVEAGFHTMLHKLYPLLKEVRCVVGCIVVGHERRRGQSAVLPYPLSCRASTNHSIPPPDLYCIQLANCTVLICILSFIHQVGEEAAELMRKAARELDVAPSHGSAVSAGGK